MKMRGHSRRLLSVLLALIMLLSLLPAAVLAADATAKTFKKVKSGDELVTGQYVLVDEKGCSPKELSGNWVTKTTVAVNGDTATASEGIWTITVSADGVVLTDASNTSIAPSGGNNNGIKKGDYKWAVAFANGTFTFSGQGTDTVKLAGNTGADNKYRAYKNKTISGYADSYPCNFTLYKLDTTPARQSGIVTDLTTLQDGDKVVVFNPSVKKAMSATAVATYYRAGVDVTLDAANKLTGYGNTELWTLGIKDGKYTFTTADNKKLSMGASFASIPLDDVNTQWTITAAATEGCFYIKNAVRGNALKWYSDKGNFSSQKSVSTTDEALFAQQLYLVVNGGGSDQPSAGLPNPGDQVVIYNQNAQAVLAAQNDNATSPAINKAAATIKDGKAACANGAAVFTVEKSGDYYRFHNKTYGYLCAGGTGNNAFYSATASDDADWLLRTCSGGVGGYEMESRTAKYKGHSQWLEYYSDSFKVYSMYNVTDYTIYSFSFYPVGPGTISDGVVNNPAVILGDLPDAYVGADYSFPFTVDAPFGVRGDITAKLNGTSLSVTKGEDGTYTVTIPAASVTGDKLTVNIKGMDNKYIPISAAAEITVKDEPVLADPTPARGSQTGENKRPTISVALDNAGQNPTVTMTVGGKTVTATYKNGRVTYTPAADLPQGRTEVTVTARRADGKSADITWFFTVGATKYQHYFGQLHSHTQYSDGAGTLTDALRYVENLPASANVQFVAFTDHSNYFDSSSSPNVEAALYDTSLVKDSDANHSWKTYKDTIAKFNKDNAGSMVAIGGFEMTWSGGPGHINTFNTPGIVSRNNKTLNNKTDDAGMKAYYALLSQAEGANSISQFNHPGTTFGNFKDFNYWDPVIDSRMYMVEVGNGEGAIGAGGYYPSYEQYIMALDKGWHLAPTNNQDNHKGKWGNANDARDVILTDDFSEQGIYEAIRALRMYATEDKNLELTYTVNGLMMGSSITEIPDKLNIEVTVNDPDASDSIAKVEVVANSGKVAYT